LACIVAGAGSDGAETISSRREDFDADPKWESYRSQLVPNPAPVTKQDFGYHESGEVGGWIQRSTTPAWYAKVIRPKTLNDRLFASGKVEVRSNSAPCGALFGWFNETSRGWRTPNSLVFRLDGNGNTYWVFFEYGTRNWRTGGGATFEGRYQTTKTKPFLADGTVHDWSLRYDPEGDGGNGLITFTFDGTNYLRGLLPGHKADGAEFNRFGIFNLQTSGGGMEVYFSDLQIDGQREEPGRDPKWEGHGNRAEFADRTIRPLHHFGYSATTNAGGKKGEVGGVIWRDEAPAFYATAVGRLTLRDELFASGKLAFTAAASDSGVYFGWFDSASKSNKTAPDHKDPQKNLLCIAVEGPSRVGHYFLPGYRNSIGEGRFASSGPLIRPDGKVHEWSLHYTPGNAETSGRIVVKLDGIEETLQLLPEQEKAGATFDRFGLLNIQTGGHFVELYLDDLTYAVGRAR
jgi:hypothetical protein